MADSVFDRDRRIRSAVLTMGQTFYLTTLNQFVGKNPDAWPSQAAIAWAMNATARAVRKWQTELEQMGVIQVDVGRGRYSTNRYRLNLDALSAKEEPRSAFNEEPRSALNSKPEIQCGTTFLPNEEPRSSPIRNHVPTERTVKEHKKEQGAALPSELDNEQFRKAWSEWVTHRREIKKKLTPSTIAKQLATLAAWGSDRAVRSIEMSISNGWCGLFHPDERSGKASPVASSEALTAWQTVLDSLKRHSRFAPDRIMGDIGEHAWQALRPIGLKKIDEANDFERRELQQRFIQKFNR